MWSKVHYHVSLSSVRRLTTYLCTTGYHIPKGTIILPNIWAMNMNEKQYDQPGRFNPERYLGPTPALESPVFGFGRRACLGVHYSTAAIFITAASMLSVFDLRAQDKDGKDVQIEPAFTGGTPPSQYFRLSVVLTRTPPPLRIRKVWP
jgi:cytochrome P450